MNGELNKLLLRKDKILAYGILQEQLGYFFSELACFLGSDDRVDKKELDEFCKSLLDEANVFSKSLEKYTRLTELGRKFSKQTIGNRSKEKECIEFTIWKNEETQLLAIFDINSYVKLDDTYNSKQIVEFYTWDIELINNEMECIKSQIDDTLGKTMVLLEKTVKRTNRLFNGI